MWPRVASCARGLTWLDPLRLVSRDAPLQEGLYEEEMPKKVRATGMIAQLFRNTENFEVGTRVVLDWVGATAGGRGLGRRSAPRA